MKKIFTLLLFIFLAFQNFTVSAQVDTAFWFAAPFVSPDATNRSPYRLHIYTYSSPSTTVSLKQPAITGSNKYDTVFVIGPYTDQIYTLWRDVNVNISNAGYDSLEVKPPDAVLPYGLYISSTSNISVVYDIIAFTINPETFSLKGLANGAGLDFYCPFQQKGNNLTVGSNAANTPPGIVQPKQQINIVATKANTTVSITPKCAVIGHPANITYTILLPNPGSAYTVENASQTTTVQANNLSGSHITSDKPISVTVADDAVRGTSGGCWDLIGDQIVPVNIVGTEYVIVRGDTFAAEMEGLYVVATNNNTSLTIDDGVVTTTVINTGDTYFYKTNQPLTSVIASKDIYVMHVSGEGCELSEGLVPPLGCAGSKETHFTRNNGQSLNLNIYCKNGSQSTFTVNGSTTLVTAAAFTVIPGTSALTGGPYYGAKINPNTTFVPVGSYTIANSVDDFGLSICNGGLSTGSYYHYMTEFAKKINVVAGPNFSVCPNTAVSLSGIINGVANTGTWTTANGTGTFGVYTSTLNTISTTYSLSSFDVFSGSVKFYLTSMGSCKPVKDSVIVNIIPSPLISTSLVTSICNNDPNPIVLSSTVTNATGSSWSTSGTGILIPSGPNTNYFPSAADMAAGFFTLSLTATGQCANVVSNFAYTVFPAPLITVTSSNSIICMGQQATLTASGANSYSWSTTSTNTAIVVSPTINTTYTVTGTAANTCSSSFTISQSVSPCTSINKNTLANDLLQIYPNPNNGEFMIEAGTDTKLIIINEMGQIVKNIVLSSDGKIIIKDLSKGIYFITGMVNNIIIKEKIVVQ